MKFFSRNILVLGTSSILFAVGCSKEESAAYSPTARQFSAITEKQGQKPLVLMPGQSVTGIIPASVIAGDATVKSAAILIGTYSNTADGDLQVKICSGGQCSVGNANLSKAKDNEVFNILLTSSLNIKTNNALNYTLSHKGGTKPVALWMLPVAGNANSQSLTGPGGTPIAGMGIEIHLLY